MIHSHDVMRQRLLDQAGLGETRATFTYEEMLRLWDTEWVPEFEQYMRNRFVMGALRYGTMASNRKKRTPYDRVGSIRKRLTAYEETGNLEMLVDIANLAMLEFDQTQHPKAHFNPLGDGERGEYCVRLIRERTDHACT